MVNYRSIVRNVLPSAVFVALAAGAAVYISPHAPSRDSEITGAQYDPQADTITVELSHDASTGFGGKAIYRKTVELNPDQENSNAHFYRVTEEKPWERDLRNR